MLNISRRLAVVSLSAIALFSFGWGPIQAQTETPTPGPLEPPAFGPVSASLISSGLTIDPAPLNPGEIATVTLRLNGQKLPDCVGIPNKPLDAMFIIDNSPSAFKTETQWINEAKAVVSRFVTESISLPVYLNRTTPKLSQAGIVTSGMSGTTLSTSLLPLTTDYPSVLAAIDGLSIGTDTVLEDSIPKVLEAFASRPADRVTDAVPALFLVLHDNGAFTTDGLAAVQKVEQAGIEVFVIAVADETQVDPAQAASFAGSANHVYYKTESRALRELFVFATGGQVFDGSSGYAARDVQVIEEVAPPGAAQIIEAVAGGLDPNGRAVWTISRDLSPTEEIELISRVQVTASGAIQFVSQAAYIDCNGFLHTSAETGDPFAESETQVGDVTSTPIPLTAPATVPPSSGDGSTIDGVTPPPGECIVIIPLVELPAPCWLIPILIIIPLVLLALLLWWLSRLRQPPKSIVSQPGTRRSVADPPVTPPKVVTLGDKETHDWTAEGNSELRPLGLGLPSTEVKLFWRPNLTQVWSTETPGLHLRLKNYATATSLSSNKDAVLGELDIQLVRTVKTNAIGSRSEVVTAQIIKFEVDAALRQKHFGTVLLKRAELLLRQSEIKATIIKGECRFNSYRMTEEARTARVFFEKMGFTIQNITGSGFEFHKTI